ncbi:MAG: glycoside hydrolase family 31 protein, partial [Bacteroidales bacterium]|nr:glycoside hydrolase family 31 protein [Bacteroidales bacterium]
MRRLLIAMYVICAFALNAQPFQSMIKSLPEEKWWGGFVAKGSQMPYIKPTGMLDLAHQNYNNQGVPLLLSNKGRYIWSDEAFKFAVTDTAIHIVSNFETINVTEVGKTLRDAYLAACQKHFPPSGRLPDTLLFSMPQYNTWIELMYNQNQNDIQQYADDILANGFPKGVLMIDDNWQKYYGNFDFKPDKFSDPKAMVERLHAQGFKIMLWVCPFVSPDSPEFRDLDSKGYLIKKKGSNQPAIIPWWNGYSACYDLTNPKAFEHYVSLLKDMQHKYGIDGFKLDAGDVTFYNPNLIDSYKKDAQTTDHTMAWAKIGLEFPFNEYRAGWRMGGAPLVQRLGDKNYSWNAARLLIPDMISAG